MIYRKPTILLEFDIRDKNRKYRISIQSDDDKNMWTHGPRLKVGVGAYRFTNIGEIPMLRNEDLSYDDLFKFQENKVYCIEDTDIRKRVTAFAVYGREEILDYIEDNSNINKNRIKDKFSEMEKKTKTINDCKKLADKAWRDRNE